MLKINSIDIERDNCTVVWQMLYIWQESVEVADWRKRVDMEKGLNRVGIAAKGVGAYDEAALIAWSHFGTIVMWVVVDGDAAWLTEIAVGRRVEVVVLSVGAHKVGVLPMEQVDIKIKGGEGIGDSVTTGHRKPLGSGGGIGKEGVGHPHEAVGVSRTHEVVADGVGTTIGVGEKHSVVDNDMRHA